MAQSQVTSTAREVILERWIEAFLEAYPEASARFFGAEPDAFSNPVGGTARRSLTSLLDYLIDGVNEEPALEALHAVVRLRAVQEIEPGKALAFLPRIKGISRDEITDPAAQQLLEALASRADALLLRAFDSYVANRERIFMLRAREARSQVHSLLRRAALVVDEPIGGSQERDPDLKGGREE
jgi:hypothetical protein